MQTVGEALRAEREKKGLSIQDIEKATSIRALYLNAIEDGNYSVAPGEVYVKGFIRNYANFLGLDPQQMIDLYRQSQAPAEPPETQEAAAEPAKESSVSEKMIRKRQKASSWTKRYIAIALIIAAGGAALWAFGGALSPAKPQADKNLAETKPAPGPAVQQPPAAVPSPPPASVPAPTAPAKPNEATAPGTAATKPVVVSAKFTDRCWILVTADGKQIFEGTPKVGDSLTWQGEREVTVRMGNAGAVDIIYNGKSAGKLGDVGEVAVKTFTANAIKP